MSRKFNIPVSVKITLKFYLVIVAISLLYRLGLMFCHLDEIAGVPFFTIVKGFFVGLHFDTVTASYVLALPFIIFTIFDFIGKKNVVFEKIMTVVMTILLAILTFAYVSDIPYYNQFADHINLTAMDWFKGDNGIKDVTNMILGDPSLWLFFIPLILVIIGIYYISKKIVRNASIWESKHYVVKSISTLVMLVLIFFGMRGYVTRERPISVYDSFYCENSFLNQMGHNPTYTFITSYLTDVTLMDDELTIANMRQYLDIQEDSGFQNPLSRRFVADTVPNNYNVVLILMESMSADLLTQNGHYQELAPFLDSLVNQSLYFENCFSAGKHTISGIFSSLCGYANTFHDDPTYQFNPVKTDPVLTYNSLPKTLKDNGYHTMFFLSHEATWEKLDVFLNKNYIDRIYSYPDYDPNAEKSNWGVCDDYLLQYAANTFNDCEKPFFGTIMTVSNHQPYIIPKSFQSHFKNDKDAVVEYADWSLRHFFETATKTEWFDNTIFVLVGDHGKDYVKSYIPPVSYFHIPLVFYAPLKLAPEVNSGFVSQVDIYPTLMDMLDISFVNNTMGINLLQEKRPMVFASGDTEYCVFDDDWYFIGSKNKPPQLYHYQDLDGKNYAEEKPEIVEKMKNYGESNFQSFNYIYKKRLQNVE